jgi:type II secretory pathway pseudopilin PulG
MVVVVIIAIILAILLPVLREAREWAKSATCLNNLKQIGVGIASYVTDNDQWFPSGRPTRYWPAHLSSYCGGPDIATLSYSGPTEQQWPLFYCPSGPRTDPLNGKTLCTDPPSYNTPTSSYRQMAVWGGYGLNRMRVYTYDYEAASSIGASDATAIVADSDARYNSIWYPFQMWPDDNVCGTGKSGVSERHQRMGNVVTWDGAGRKCDNVSTYFPSSKWSSPSDFHSNFWMGGQKYLTFRRGKCQF